MWRQRALVVWWRRPSRRAYGKAECLQLPDANYRVVSRANGGLLSVQCSSPSLFAAGLEAASCPSLLHDRAMRPKNGPLLVGTSV